MRILAPLLVVALAAPLAGQVTRPEAPGAQAPTRLPPRDAAAPAPTGTGRIRGRIVQAATDMPLRRAQVTLSGENVQRQVTSDGEGGYEFSELPAGRFTVSAAKGGYVTLQYGQRRAFEPGRPIALAAAQVVGRVDLALPRGGVITGRVTDRFGEPAVGADVLVERYQYGSDGQRRLSRAPGVAPSTNDLGEFRAFGLMPGEYVVSANIRQRPQFPGQSPDSPAEGYVATYHPGTPFVGDAQAVLLDIGQEVSVQFSLTSGRLSRISGTITDSTGQPASGADLMLATPSANSLGASGRGVGSVAVDGAFSITNVTPGEHFLQVRLSPRPGGATGPEVANVPVSASGENVTGLTIVTSPAATVRGRVEWEGNAPRAGGSATMPLRIVTSAADGRPPLIGPMSVADPAATGAVGQDNTFRIGGLLGSVRFNATGVPPQWTLKAVIVGTTDVTNVGTDVMSLGADTSVRVVLTDKVTELSGSVRTVQGQPAAEYVVVVLPEDAMDATVASRYTHAIRPDQKGAFRLRALPPGRYVAVAVEALEQGSEWDPVFQAAVRNAARRFTLDEGQAQTLTLDLMP